MYIRFECDSLFSIACIREPSPFFANISLILPPNDCVIGVASYLPEGAIAKWLHNLPDIEIPRQFDFKHLVKSNSENPDGGAFYFSATEFYLNQAAHLASLVASPEFLCSHVICFRGEKPILMYHDAFQYDDMLVSSDVPVEQIEAFRSALGVGYKLVPNPQLRN